MSLETPHTTCPASARSDLAAVTTLDLAHSDWQLEYRHTAEPCLLLKRRCGRVLRGWDRAQTVAILSHPRSMRLLCLPSLCHGRCISLDKTQAKTLLIIAACCSLSGCEQQHYPGHHAG